MSSSIAKKINSAKANTNIIDSICKALEEKKISYTKSQSEIVIKDHTKKRIMNIIDTLIDKNNISLLLDVVETKKTVYIRKKISAT